LHCEHCDVDYPRRQGYLDVCPDIQERITPIQYLCQSPPMIAIYDKIWRPFGYRFTSSRSFPEDLDRIAALMEPSRHGLVLDLACGPGNFTRSVAGHGTDVVGFDLATQMLKRAVELSPPLEYPNITYMRGNALAMPFESASFDAVICCAALQLFTDYDKALAEVSRILKPGGEFVCQTIGTSGAPPFWLRLADRIMRFGYFDRDTLKAQLRELQLEVVEEESSKLSYIFRAAKKVHEETLVANVR
jgi:ubiquinone/menaquinone biosynthesis C-methylase UbiE